MTISTDPATVESEPTGTGTKATVDVVSLDKSFAQAVPKEQPKRLWQITIAVVITLLFLEGLARVIAVIGQYNPIATNEYKTKLAIAQAPSKSPIIFFLGSSYTSRSVYADLLTARLRQRRVNLEARNLAMLGRGAAPEVQLMLLDSAIKSGAKPAVVFYDVSPLFGYLAAKEEQRARIAPYVPYIFTYREKYGALLRALPGMLVAPDSTSSTGAFAVRDDKISGSGWDPRYDIVDRNTLTDSLALRKNLAWSERNNPQYLSMMEPVAKYCAQHRIPLVLVWYPAIPASDQFFEKIGLSADKFADVCRETTRKWHVQFMNMHQPLDSTFFCDCDHVNAAGACLVTEKLAKVIGQGQSEQSDPLEELNLE